MLWELKRSREEIGFLSEELQRVKAPIAWDRRCGVENGLDV